MSKIPKNNIHLKRKRNMSTSLSNFALTSSYFRPNKSKKNSNNIRLIKVISQPYLREKSITAKPIYDTNLVPSKIMTPQNRIKIKDSLISPQSSNRTFLDNDSIFLSIISKIEKIISSYGKNILKLNYLLIKIENFINSLINEEKFNKTNSAYNKIKPISSKKNAAKMENEKEIINKLESSNEMKRDENITNENELLKKKVNKLYQKINEMEIKFKIDELNYFFCIGEHQKKITELEKKLNMRDIDKMPKEELKQFICYPHYVKFDVREEINPKSIPMFNQKKEKEKDKEKCKTSTDKGKNGITFFIPNERDFDNFYKKIKNENEKILSDKGIEIDNVKETIKLGKQEYDTQIPIADKFFGKKKSFFVSHPKLNYIKVGNDGNKLTSWKIDNQLNNFPQQISKLKMSKSQKNAMIVFPSSFNETMVNLEKLRTNKNFQSIENQFEETLKKNKKNNKNEK